MQIGFYILLSILGACFGSFLCCEARRFHLKTANQKRKSPKLSSRSVCLHCNHRLKWYENIPILSWLFLRGKCRKCHQKIGIAELLSELGGALAFFALSTTITVSTADFLTWAIFIATLLLVLVLGFLAIYDGLYGELPTSCLILSIAIAILVLILKTCQTLISSPFSAAIVYQPLLSIVILGGLYLALYLISKGKWVGDGDWLLGTAIAIALVDPWLALVTLFIANLLACLTMYPVIRKQKHAKIYFGPFMVIAFIVTLTFADFFYYAIGG